MSKSSNNANGGCSGSALCSVQEFTSQNYDYIVVGGGTAGLCVAARLTENPGVKVGVIEAGANRMDDKQISTPSLYPTLIGREQYDWCMTSIPQVRQLSFGIRVVGVLDLTSDSHLLETNLTPCRVAKCLAAALP
jgi:hypothetical protein